MSDALLLFLAIFMASWVFWSAFSGVLWFLLSATLCFPALNYGALAAIDALPACYTFPPLALDELVFFLCASAGLALFGNKRIVRALAFLVMSVLLVCFAALGGMSWVELVNRYFDDAVVAAGVVWGGFAIFLIEMLFQHHASKKAPVQKGDWKPRESTRVPPNKDGT